MNDFNNNNIIIIIEIVLIPFLKKIIDIFTYYYIP